MNRLRLATDGPEETRAVAAELATVLMDGDLLVLTGDLGAGKTCFAQGLGVGLGIEDRITSPTFTLANRYAGRLVLHHLDVYRLDTVGEAIDLGLPELLEDGVTVIEWGDRIDRVLPADHLLVTLRYPDLDPDVGHGSDPVAGPAESRRLIDIACPGAGCRSPVDGRDASRWSGRALDRLLARWMVTP